MWILIYWHMSNYKFLLSLLLSLYNYSFFLRVYTYIHIQDLAGVAHDDIDPSVFCISDDEQKVRCIYVAKSSLGRVRNSNRLCTKSIPPLIRHRY